MRCARCGIILFLGLVANASGLDAQTAAVRVSVTGPDGPVPGAAVEVLRGGAQVLGTSADSAGIARLAGLAAGVYGVRVDALGYRPRTVDVELGPGEARRLDVILEPAPVELERIEVRADRIQIQRENTDFATTVNEETIELLPVPYDPAQLVALTPGARAGHVWGGANFQANSYRIDGVSANHPGLGGSIIEPSMTWIERVEVRGLGAGADHGGFQGGQVDVITKSGGDRFAALFRSTMTADALAGSNLEISEIGSEVKARYDVEGEVSGPLIRDRLYYYVGGAYVDRSARYLNHFDFQQRFLPFLEERVDQKLFGKLTWIPGGADELELSGGYLGTDADNYGMTGYEGPGAATRYSAPTWFGTASWRRSIGDGATFEVRLNHFDRDERSDPYGGIETPGIRRYDLVPPYTSSGNAPFTLRSAPSSTSAALAATFRLRAGGEEHLVKVGGEYTRGRFLDRRTRSGGMTWMPLPIDGFDDADPSTWPHPQHGYIPTQWGGEVNVDADVANAAAFVQTSLSLGRLVLSPGLRWGSWTGWLDPRSGARFRAVADQGWDPRIGATLELVEDGTFVVKAHWGRYHQDLISQMFDRAGGSDAFSNEEIWYYHGEPPADPGQRFSEAERDALEDQGLFTRESVITLNETGPAVDYEQPYVDQWVVGLEKQFGSSVKVEALYTRRSNRDMVALVDRNRETNFTRYDQNRVHMGGADGAPSTPLSTLYIPNNVILEELRYCAAHAAVCDPPPGFTFADTLSLSWDPDYVLTTAPGAVRDFQQIQLTVKVARTRWGASFSVAATGLEGNLDNVSGYADPAQFSPGPYVRLNEGVNAFGALPNFAEREAKVSIWGLLPWELRGGAFWTYRSGDHYSSRFRLSAEGNLYGYRTGVGARYYCSAGGSWGLCDNDGEPLPISFFEPLEGHHVFIGKRGHEQMRMRSNLDLRLERRFELRGTALGVALDLFNALGSEAVTRVQTMVNHGENYRWEFDDLSTEFRQEWAGKWYESPLERVPPRTLRVGMTLYF